MTFKKAMLRGIIGFPVGIFISVTITMFISIMIGNGQFYSVVPELIDRTHNEVNAFVLQYILSGLLGFAFAAGSAVFEVDNWSIAKQTMIHFFISSVALLPIAYACRWMDNSLKGVASYFLIFVGSYVIVWFAQYTTWKKKIIEINGKLKNKS